MKNFARQWLDPTFQFSWLLLAITCHLCLFLGIVVSLLMQYWLHGTLVVLVIFLLTYTFLAVVWYGSNRYV